MSRMHLNSYFNELKFMKEMQDTGHLENERADCMVTL